MHNAGKVRLDDQAINEAIEENIRQFRRIAGIMLGRILEERILPNEMIVYLLTSIDGSRLNFSLSLP